MQKKINIAKDYSVYPYGRDRQRFEFGGERFRQDILVPALKEFDSLLIILDGTEGYGSSFLDESFANLIRKDGFDKKTVLSKIKFISENDPSLILEIQEYINEA